MSSERTAETAGTWKTAAGRSSGGEDYQVGDLTRSVLNKAGSALSTGGRKVRKSFQKLGEPLRLTLPGLTSAGSGPGSCDFDVPVGVAGSESAGSPLFIPSVRQPATSSSAGFGDPREAGAGEGLRRLREGLRLCEGLHLPHARQALDCVRQGVEELEARYHEAALWQKHCPSGGNLTKVQICFAAGSEKPPDWSMGQLFSSTKALLFESSEVPPWQIGPLSADDIKRAELLEDVDKELDGRAAKGADAPGDGVLGAVGLRLRLRDGSAYTFTGIGFGGLESFDWLEELGVTLSRCSSDAAEDSTSSFGSCVSEEDDQALGGWLQHHVTVAEESWKLTAEPPPSAEKPVEPAPSWLPTQPVTETFIRAADALPLPEELREARTCYETVIQDATLDGIVKVMSSPRGPVHKYYKEQLGATDLKSTPWAPARRLPGTKTQRTSLRLPVPKDVPPAVAGLVNLPETTRMTVLLRIGRDKERVVFVHECCTHDVTFGEHFWVQDVLVFQPHPDGGVRFDKMVEIRWVQALPWYAKVLKSVIESKSKLESQSSGLAVAKALTGAK